MNKSIFWVLLGVISMGSISLLVSKQVEVNKISKIEDKILKLGKEKSDLEYKNGFLKAENTSLISQKEKLGGEVKLLKTTVSGLGEVIKKESLEVAKIRADGVSKITKNASLDHDIKIKQDLLDSLESDIQKIKDANPELKEDINKVNQIANLNKKIEEINLENSKLKEQIAIRIKKEVEKLNQSNSLNQIKNDVADNVKFNEKTVKENKPSEFFKSKVVYPVK